MDFPTDISVEEFADVESYLEHWILNDHMSAFYGTVTEKQKEKWIENDKPILFEYAIGKVASKVLALTFQSVNSYKRIDYYVKWNGSTDRIKFRKARGADVVAKAHGYTSIIDASLNSRSEPQLSRELGSFRKHLKRAKYINSGSPVIGIFATPRISDRLWDLYSHNMRAATVLLDVKNLAKIYEVSQFGIPIQHAQIRGYLNRLSFKLNNSRSRNDYQGSLNNLTKEFVRDFLRSSYDLFLSTKVYSVFVAKSQVKLTQSEIVDELKKDKQIQELIGFVDQRVRREEDIRDKLKEDLNGALDRYKLVVLDELPTSGDPIYLKPECEDSKCTARVIDSVC